ncbi:MAG: glutaredoxin 3 [Gammaproteobacteria bacterium RIFCSPHIGHO2_12_FULL_35_23]|nr:MAG: glutaredoxin 3 [Gammaproteobacteria bacterium RIFCSPHIGHO2_12_FULL_35_23]
MTKVIIYSTQICPYCIRAKQLLDKKGVHYTEIKVDEDSKQQEIMEKITGRRTVPQIIINDEPIGGCDQLYTLEREGKLDKLLNQERS